MRTLRITYFSLFSWLWLKIGLYCFCFLFFQLSNDGGASLTRFGANVVIFMAAVGIIETGQYSLQLLLRKRAYRKGTLILVGSYTVLAILGFYVFHGSDNLVSSEIWNKKIEASWSAFIRGFNVFYWTFFKYALIFLLAKQVFLFWKLIKYKEVKLTALDKESRSAHLEVGAAALENKRALEDFGMLTIKSGKVTYMLSVENIVYLEVCDELTTVYQINGEELELKISLSRFFEMLPKSRFVRVHESRVIALPYVLREEQGCIYMTSYEDKALKLGNSERYPAYKEWKESNRVK